MGQPQPCAAPVEAPGLARRRIVRSTRPVSPPPPPPAPPPPPLPCPPAREARASRPVPCRRLRPAPALKPCNPFHKRAPWRRMAAAGAEVQRPRQQSKEARRAPRAARRVRFTGARRLSTTLPAFPPYARPTPPYARPTPHPHAPLPPPTPQRMFREFTPSWFTACMGTGSVALAVATFPWPFPGEAAAGEAGWRG
jgi:hypothetical protein